MREDPPMLFELWRAGRILSWVENAYNYGQISIKMRIIRQNTHSFDLAQDKLHRDK
jgi:hypothetical protein